RLQFMGAIQANIGGVSGIESPRALSMTPDGKYLYVIGGDGNNAVVFSRQTNSGSGTFGQLAPIPDPIYQNGRDGILGMDDVRSLVLDADGSILYVLGGEAGALVHFTRNADGSLSFVPAAGGGSLLLPELGDATRLRMGGDGRMYVAS